MICALFRICVSQTGLLLNLADVLVWFYVLMHVYFSALSEALSKVLLRWDHQMQNVFGWEVKVTRGEKRIQRADIYSVAYVEVSFFYFRLPEMKYETWQLFRNPMKRRQKWQSYTCQERK